MLPLPKCSCGIPQYLSAIARNVHRLLDIGQYSRPGFLWSRHTTHWHHPCEYSFGTVESHVPYICHQYTHFKFGAGLGSALPCVLLLIFSTYLVTLITAFRTINRKMDKLLLTTSY